MRKAIAFLIACAVLAMPVLAVPDIGARAAILINADTGKVLYERNADERMLIASTTKIMTRPSLCSRTAAWTSSSR